jgi:hypothetical protein
VADDWAPDRSDKLHRLVVAAANLDGLLDSLELGPAARSSIPVLVVGIDFHDYDVGPVAPRVGVRPRHVTGAAGDQRRCAGQSHAGDPPVAAGAVGPDERCAVPDVRHREAQVHVAREQRAAVDRPGAGDRPVVAARPDDLGVAGRQRRSLLETRTTLLLPNVVDLGAGEPCRRHGTADDRGVPLRSGRHQELTQLRGQRLEDQTSSPIGAAARVLKL